MPATAIIKKQLNNHNNTKNSIQFFIINRGVCVDSFCFPIANQLTQKKSSEKSVLTEKKREINIRSQNKQELSLEKKWRNCVRGHQLFEAPKGNIPLLKNIKKKEKNFIPITIINKKKIIISPRENKKEKLEEWRPE